MGLLKQFVDDHCAKLAADDARCTRAVLEKTPHNQWTMQSLQMLHTLMGADEHKDFLPLWWIIVAAPRSGV
jgi:hypothetical protein